MLIGEQLFVLVGAHLWHKVDMQKNSAAIIPLTPLLKKSFAVLYFILLLLLALVFLNLLVLFFHRLTLKSFS